MKQVVNMYRFSIFGCHVTCSLSNISQQYYMKTILHLLHKLREDIKCD